MLYFFIGVIVGILISKPLSRIFRAYRIDRAEKNRQRKINAVKNLIEDR